MLALPIKTTENVTKMMRKLIITYDCPNTMISDNAAEFTSEAIKKLCAYHGIKNHKVSNKVLTFHGIKKAESCTISLEFNRNF